MRIFISHASFDKPTIAMPLYNQLKSLNLEPWIDKNEIHQSDDIFEAINKGILKSNYAVAIISPSYIKSDWANNELGSIYDLTKGKVKKIRRLFLIYHNISKEQVVEIYPLLSSIYTFNSSDGVEFIANNIKSIIINKQEIERCINNKKNGEDFKPIYEDELPSKKEAFYMMMNMQQELKKVKDPFLEEIVKRLSIKEREQLSQILVKNLILTNPKYAKLYDEVVSRIPHRGFNEKLELDFRLISDDILVSVLMMELDEENKIF